MRKFEKMAMDKAFKHMDKAFKHLIQNYKTLNNSYLSNSVGGQPNS